MNGRSFTLRPTTLNRSVSHPYILLLAANEVSRHMCTSPTRRIARSPGLIRILTPACCRIGRFSRERHRAYFRPARTWTRTDIYGTRSGAPVRRSLRAPRSAAASNCRCRSPRVSPLAERRSICCSSPARARRSRKRLYRRSLKPATCSSSRQMSGVARSPATSLIEHTWYCGHVPSI